MIYKDKGHCRRERNHRVRCATMTFPPHMSMKGVVPMPHEAPQTHLRIVAIGTNRLVTVVEVLSPANQEKDPGCQSSLDKREDIFQSAAHLVEIDLLRAWRPMPCESPYENSDYRIMIS